MSEPIYWDSIEIRDRMTFIPALAIYITPRANSDGYLFRRSFTPGTTTVVLMRLDKPAIQFDPYDWADRTMTTVHEHLCTLWQTEKCRAQNREVFDVEYILDEVDQPKTSEYPA